MARVAPARPEAQAPMSVYNGTGPFVAFNLFAIAGILLSVLMLNSGVFPKYAAIGGSVTLLQRSAS